MKKARGYEHPRDGLSYMGKFLYACKMIRFYKNGDAYGFVFNWWNPLSWIMGVLLLFIMTFLDGFPRTWNTREEIGFRVDPYFKRNDIKVEWIY